jgi:hypothetical protein
MAHRLQPTPRHRLVGALAVAVAPLLLAGCEIAAPKLPAFTTRLAVPLGEKRLLIADLIDDEEYLIALADGTLGFTVSGAPDTVSLARDLGADVPRREVNGELGTFSLALDTGTEFAFTLGELYADAVQFDGLVMPVPAFGFDTLSSAADVADLQSATLAAGTLTVTVGNGLPVPISATDGPDSLVLDLLDAATSAVIVSVGFDLIAPDAEAVRTADLAGVELPDQVAVRLAGGSPGSGADAVLVDAATTISVVAAFSDLEVTAAVAVIPPQAFTTSVTTALPDAYQIVQAVVASGQLTVAVHNQMTIACQAVVTWPTVLDLDDQPLRVVLDLADGDHQERLVDFAAHIIRAPAGQTLDALEAIIDVTSPGSAGQAVALHADQGVLAEIGDGRIEFHSVTGTVPARSYDLAPTTAAIDLPDALDGLQLCRATLTLALTSTADLPAAALFDLVGVSQSGSTHDLQVHEAIPPAAGGRATTTHIVLDETNSDIVAFLNNLPIAVTLSGAVALGGDGAPGTIRRDDLAIISWEIVSPVEVIIESSQLHGEATALDLGRDLRDRITDHLGQADVELAILNHLPVGVQTHLLLGPDPDRLQTDPLLVIGPVAVDAGELAPSGMVSEPNLFLRRVTLSAAQTRLLATAGLHSQLAVTLPSTEGDPVRVMSTDYITVQGLVFLDIEVHDNR